MGSLGVAVSGLACRPGRAFVALFGLSLSIQGFILTKISPEAIRPDTRWEAPAIAVALAERGTFADAFALPTGATAHLPPIPVALSALCYKLLGTGLAGGYAAWVVEMTIQAVLVGMLPWVAGSVGLGVGTGFMAGLVGSFIPRWSGHGEGLAGVAMALLMVAFVRAWTRGRRRLVGSLLLGLGAGAAFHVQPALLPVVLGWMAFELWWSRERRKRLHGALMALGMVLACVPWGWRNYRAFDTVFFVRDNLGLELRMGNHPGAEAAMDAMDRLGEHRHPRALEEEARKVQEMGEPAYMRAAGREARSWMRENPGRFAAMTLSRAAHWWLGPFYYPPGAMVVTALTLLAVLGAWRALPRMEVPQRAAVLVPLLTFPLIYYIVAYMPRYREPVDWIFLLLAVAALSRSGPPWSPATVPSPTPST